MVDNALEKGKLISMANWANIFDTAIECGRRKKPKRMAEQ